MHSKLFSILLLCFCFLPQQGQLITEVSESSLQIAAETLVQAGIPMIRALRYVRAARTARCASLHAIHKPKNP